MLFFSSKVGLAAIQVLLNVQVTSTLKIHSILALFVVLKARLVICIFPEVKFYIFLLLETYLGTWQFPPFLFKQDSVCFSAAVLSAFCVASCWCAEHPAGLALWDLMQGQLEFRYQNLDRNFLIQFWVLENRHSLLHSIVTQTILPLINWVLWVLAKQRFYRVCWLHIH